MLHGFIDPQKIRLWKKRLLVGGALVFGLGLVGCSVGAYGLYSLGKHVSSNVDINSIGEALPDTFGPVTGTIVTVASEWATSTVEAGEAQSVKHGLACLDALGGPDATQLLETLADKASNPEGSDALRKVAAELSVEAKSRPSSCLTFLVG